MTTTYTTTTYTNPVADLEERGEATQCTWVVAPRNYSVPKGAIDLGLEFNYLFGLKLSKNYPHSVIKGGESKIRGPDHANTYIVQQTWGIDGVPGTELAAAIERWTGEVLRSPSTRIEWVVKRASC
ncbi:hypothetical protein CC1G_03073 [Coprinopsis cinerea okayama7|uniref:Uncharacterized protein n=1 Tax=Coprinopsis cinerea (strain Okayama-7 / 130 / ATCC MYA-4618 / FGSC 9003) TaxID=240176 RepID=A8PEU0_COPC7|nr:hypothetical protein CC1G_03073 [Coprinopsis cinerea okayama7\|eukprot:XP_001840844.2 hypothetical protein CC1G_03073 [Coprinopsis cinerea okayama7\